MAEQHWHRLIDKKKKLDDAKEAATEESAAWKQPILLLKMLSTKHFLTSR